MKGFKKMLFGEKMPDKQDPKYKERYERDVAAGRKFAKTLRIDKAAAKVQKFADIHRTLFLVIVFSFVAFIFGFNIFRIVKVYNRGEERRTATELQDSLLKARHDRLVSPIGVSGVGISFGADRIFDVLNQLDLYPKEAVNGTQLLFINFGEKEAAFSMNVLTEVRAAGIRAEIFPDASKMKKQMGYANSKAIPFVALVGENEMNEGKVTLKNMETGEQKMVTPQELVSELK